MDPFGGSVGRRHRGSRIDPLALAVVAKEHLEHVDHASALVVRSGLEGQLERWRNTQVQRVAFNVVESHGLAPQVSVHLRYSSWAPETGIWVGFYAGQSAVMGARSRCRACKCSVGGWSAWLSITMPPLDASTQVVVYAKLLRGFFIPSPVGNYNSDQVMYDVTDGYGKLMELLA